MRWLIDGYNVIRRDAELRARESESLESGRTALLHLLAPVARRSQDSFTVVFDGARRGGPAPPGGRVEVLFSRPPETADDVVIRLAARWRDGAIVVSSDRTIQQAARRAGAVALEAEAFIAALAAGDDDDRAPDDDDRDDDDRDRRKRGNPRRASKADRAAGRAIRRLRGHR
ncbi:MAG: NYN domain-containing protein [Candidatus Rokuibacteriota bacterium]